MCHCIPHFKPNYTIIIQIDLTNQCLRLTEYPHEDKEGHGEERGAREEDGGETEGRAGWWKVDLEISHNFSISRLSGEEVVEE